MPDHTYTLRVQGIRYPVSRTVYRAYYKLYERERYVRSLAAGTERSLERFAEDGVSVEYQYAMSRPSMEDAYFHKLLLGQLRNCMAQLNDDERKLIKPCSIRKRANGRPPQPSVFRRARSTTGKGNCSRN